MPPVDPECRSIVAAFRRRNVRSAAPQTAAARAPMYRRSGSSFDLKCIREYQSFDDPRAIDWKLLARSDRAYVREFYDEASEGVAFLIDASASRQGDRDQPAFVSSLAYMLLCLGLSVTAWAYADGLSGPRLSMRGAASHHNLSRALDSLAPEGPTDTAKAYRQLRAQSPLRRVFVFSDFHEPGLKLAAPPSGSLFLVRFRIGFETLARDAGELEVIDPESAATIVVPWDRHGRNEWKLAEEARERALASMGPRSSYYRLDRGADRQPAYWSILDRLYA